MVYQHVMTVSYVLVMKFVMFLSKIKILLQNTQHLSPDFMIANLALKKKKV